MAELLMRSDRKINAADLNGLWEAIGWRSRPTERWQRALDASSHVRSLWEGATLVAFGRILEDGVMAMFYDIAVHPNYQRHGHGRRLMEELTNLVKDGGYASLGLFAWSGNPDNKPFYESLGFEDSSGMELTRFMVEE